MSVVLIAEDDAPLRELFADIVGALGHRPLLAADGDEALARARAERPDVVLCDHLLPGRTGLDVLQALRADPATSGAPFILTSATPPPGADAAWAFLRKPVRRDELEALLARALGGNTSSTAQRSLGESRLADELVAHMAHELRTPLASAVLVGGFLKSRLQQVGTQSDLDKLATLQRQLDRMTTLVDNMVTAARLAEGKLSLRVARQDLPGFLDAMLARWRGQWPDAELHLDRAAAPPDASFDALRVQEILEPLVARAMRRATPRRADLRVEARGDDVIVHVRDFGPPLTAEQLAGLFERVGRSDDGPRGLGLFIAQGLAALHGGRLTARAADPSSGGDETGTVISLRLPRRAGLRAVDDASR